MKISLNWLKDYVSFKINPQTIAHKLTMAGFEVEKISSIGKETVFELEITPNRPDCLSYIGIAREVSAILDTSLKVPKVKKVKFPKGKCPVTILDKKGCRRYFGAVIENVNVKESPRWLKERLESAGIRSVNNIVDVTNFVLLETGQPLHAFDCDRLRGNKIIVRRAEEGEKIITIDGDEHSLDPSILVIADAEQPVAVAGIMGGKETEVSRRTKSILLEGAFFDPVLVRRGARKLGLSTDSSYRFEREVNIATVGQWAQRAMNLIQEVAGGCFIAISDSFPVKKEGKGKMVKVSLGEINQFLGSKMTLSRCKAILVRLGFDVVSSSRGHFIIKVPSFRRDIAVPVDIMEEIARVVGYDNLPASLPHIKASRINEPRAYLFREKIREIMTAQGLDEVISFTLINSKGVGHDVFSEKEGIVGIQNPLTSEQEIMRPSLLPSLLSLILSNIKKGQKDLRLFETGKVYLSSGEREVLGIIMTGDFAYDWRKTKKDPLGFYDIKGVVEKVLEKFKIQKFLIKPVDENIFQKGQSALLEINKFSIGRFGALKKDILDQWDIKNMVVYYAEINLQKLSEEEVLSKGFQPICEFPAISRDISLAVKEGVLFQEVKDVAFSSGAQDLVSIHFVEEYKGEKIQKGFRGLTFTLTYQSLSRTLLDREINEAHEKIRLNLIRILGAIPR